MTPESKDAHPLVTVITPTYNREKFLSETIESVLKQDYPNIEYIVLDDGSHDNTQVVVEKYLSRLTYIKHDNIGETKTVNKGYALANGEFIVVINSDDPFYSMTGISQAVQCFKEHPKALAVYPDWVFTDEDGAVTKTMRLPDFSIHNMLSEFNVTLGPAMFIKKTALEQVGLRNESLKYTGDLDMSFRLALAGELAHLHAEIGTHRIHNDAASSTCQGSRMASEVLRLATTSLQDSRLPVELKKNKRKMLTQTYSIAHHFCGNDHKSGKDFEREARVALGSQYYVIMSKQLSARIYSAMSNMTRFLYRTMSNMTKPICSAVSKLCIMTCRVFIKTYALLFNKTKNEDDPLNILYITYTDVPGSRFNGHDLAKEFNAKGHHASMFVFKKNSDNSIAREMLPTFAQKVSVKTSTIVESFLRINYLWSFAWIFLIAKKEFRNADLVHYHLLHPGTGFVGIVGLPVLTKLKPSVWSIHDPWITTGHCVHPFDCTKWQTQCDECQHPEWPLAVSTKDVHRTFRWKKKILKHSSVMLVALSNWMSDRLKESPLTAHLPQKVITPGLDLHVFSPQDKLAAKQHLGVDPDKVVIGFRNAIVKFKGLPYLIEALAMVKRKEKIHLLTCQETGNLESIDNEIKITHLGTIIDEKSMAHFFAATDIHLMPSIAESFGMMAMEAAACGVPSIVFEGTPLPEVSFAPEGSIAVPYQDSSALAKAIDELIENVELRETLGKKARELAMRHYSKDKNFTETLKLYRELLSSVKIPIH